MIYSADKDPAIVAEEAQQLLNNPLLLEAFASVETSIVEQMKRAPVVDNPDAEAFSTRLILSLQLTDAVRTRLQEYVDTGRINKVYNEE